ncbi:MAG: hypothetical protein FJW61_05235 [Actinobacteria bacterium]|nr:hypothetical protein [Actinomycetota bacterium]
MEIFIEKNNFIGFLDETGVLAEDPNQRFFGLGLLKLYDTSILYSELWKLKNKAESQVSNYRTFKLILTKKPFEFKFSKINNSNCSFYLNLLKIYFKIPKLNFTAYIVDKNSEVKKINKHNVWENYINLSCTLIKNNIYNDEKLFVIADYFSKPNYSRKFWERAVRNIAGVYNAIMLESYSTLFLQLTDILVGAVTYDYKITIQGLKPNNAKLNVTRFIKRKLGINSLTGNIKIEKPNYFCIKECALKNASHQLS